MVNELQKELNKTIMLFNDKQKLMVEKIDEEKRAKEDVMEKFEREKFQLLEKFNRLKQTNEELSECKQFN